MPKPKLPNREAQICRRLRSAREKLGFTQLECAKRVGVERSTLNNYECAVSPVRCEVALRFCRQLIVSEEWLATGKTDAMRQAAVKSGIKASGDWRPLEAIFFRQCMDLLAEPITLRLPHGELFSIAYDRFLAGRYAELAQRFFYAPRIVFNESDQAPLGVSLIGAFIERHLAMLANEARARAKNPWQVQREFIRAVIEANSHLFRKFMGFPLDREALRDLAWLKATLDDPACVLGSMHREGAALTEGDDVDLLEASAASGKIAAGTGHK